MLTRDFTNTDKKTKFENDCYIMRKLFKPKSVKVQPWTPLEVISDEFYL